MRLFRQQHLHRLPAKVRPRCEVTDAKCRQPVAHRHAQRQPPAKAPQQQPPPSAEAQRPTEPPAPPEPDEAELNATQPRQVTGEVLSFAQNELHVLSGSDDVRMLVISGTEVRVNGQPATAADIREGGEVRATYEIAEGQPVALVVELQRAEGASARL